MKQLEISWIHLGNGVYQYDVLKQTHVDREFGTDNKFVASDGYTIYSFSCASLESYESALYVKGTDDFDNKAKYDRYAGEWRTASLKLDDILIINKAVQEYNNYYSNRC